jgi:UDP-glucoronosyl and UDP-glucosyl transferase
LVPQKLEKLLSIFHLSDKLQSRLAGEERKVWDTLSEWSLNICKILLHDDTLSSLFRDGTFDLIFVNAAFGECGYLLNVRWKAKIILTDSTSLLPYFNDMLGLTLETHWIPDISSQFIYPMSFSDRLWNFFYSLKSHYERSSYLYPELEKLMKDHYAGQLPQSQIPSSFNELERRMTNLVFLNTHYSTDFARALSPNMIHIGGLQLWDTRREPVKKVSDRRRFILYWI